MKNVYTTEKIGERTYRIDECGRDNCYLLLGEKSALLIDSSIGTGNLKAVVRSITSLPVTVAATRPSRRYFTDFARLTPPDTVILTLACGKFRLNDLPLGTVAGLPRLLDVGQCNDAYSAIRIALALADAFDCSVNDLPLSLLVCWFEQKAVCVLLALLALGIRNIRLGPTLPAFLSPGVAAALQEKYNLMPTTTPEQDLHAILGD